MPQILINTNDIDLEKIERMQNEKDENSRKLLKFNTLTLNSENTNTECLNQETNK